MGTDGSLPTLLLADDSGAGAFDDSNLSRRLLQRLRGVPDGVTVVRAYVPEPTAAFSGRDRLRPGFPAALTSAAARGFTPVIRPVGGTAVVYDECCLVVDVLMSGADRDPAPGYGRVSTAVAAALRSLGADARVGEIPGEYCPGGHSVNVGGTLKVAGIAQRAAAGARLVSTVLVVGACGQLEDATSELYDALEYSWDRSTFGAVEHAIPGVGVDVVREAVLHELAAGEVMQVSPGRCETLLDAMAGRVAA